MRYHENVRNFSVIPFCDANWNKSNWTKRIWSISWVNWEWMKILSSVTIAADTTHEMRIKTPIHEQYIVFFSYFEHIILKNTDRALTFFISCWIDTTQCFLWPNSNSVMSIQQKCLVCVRIDSRCTKLCHYNDATTSIAAAQIVTSCGHSESRKPTNMASDNGIFRPLESAVGQCRLKRTWTKQKASTFNFKMPCALIWTKKCQNINQLTFLHAKTK